MRHARAAWVPAFVALLIACPWARPDGERHASTSWTPVVLQDREVAAALTTAEQRRERALAGAPDPASVASAPEALAAALEQCYRLGALDVAERIVADHAGVCASAQELPEGVTSACTFAYRESVGTMRVLFRRSDATRPLVVALAPGSFAVRAEARAFEAERCAQDLAFLRARVVTFAPGARQAETDVPIACAKFDADAPTDGQSYVLRRFERGSDLERLMGFLCAEELKQECRAQLAVWTLRNGMTQGDLDALLRVHYVPTFQSPRRFEAADLRGTAQLFLDAGIDPRGMKFFGGKAAAKAPGNRS